MRPSADPGWFKIPCGVPWVLIFALAVAGCAPRQAFMTVPVGDESPPAESYDPQVYRGVYHTIGAGQTLWRIAHTYGVELETLQWVNDIEDVTDLRVGRVLFIPGAERIMEIEPFVAAEQTPSRERIAVIWPLRGRATSGYGPRGRRDHQGIDLAAPTGTEVMAAAGGRVVYSGNGMKGYGKVIVIKHENELSSVYAHNSRLLVRMGDVIRQGQIIALVGATGRATGPHLHFEIRRRGVPEDPLEYLPEI
ncbi:MAG: peptidoglycan DD-metalloendopeptidase family protein [bacterium]|nr:MAG: peptidoglycan DD-metalloendopeptidase family protein [bacterium]